MYIVRIETKASWILLKLLTDEIMIVTVRGGVQTRVQRGSGEGLG